MLQAINVSKIYNPKNGTTVKALDGVTISFAEKGMVFLLGKSGSGKSTLLNVCGGLDSPTSGEIVVKGRSSKDFSQSDFDSYRNTFVGFIFQEYNILNEFSVEDNIALALELQGKPKDKKVIAELLEQVDLTGFGKRKPNTLSGGQKQRIAIAPADAIFGAAYLPLDKTPESIQGFWEVYNSEAYNEDGSKTYLASNFIYQLQMVDDLVEDSSKIFLYVGLVLALFAALLFSNFISVSISQKKREIGILRAVGARSADVFKIFFSESAFIAIICVVLASIGSVIGCNLLNSSLTGVIGASLFVFGVMSFLVLVGIAALTAIIATFLPVWNAARKKPVESIRAI